MSVISKVMQRYGIENEVWFEAARTGLERRGFKLRIQQRSIIIDKEGRLPRIVSSAREFLEFAERQGLRIEHGAMEAAERYGDSRSDLSGRLSDSPFETPVSSGALVNQMSGFRGGLGNGMWGRGTATDTRRPDTAGVEGRLAELRMEQERQSQERRAALQAVHEKTQLEARCRTLEAELSRLHGVLAETAKQRDLYQMSAIAAEERVRLLQHSEIEPLAGPSGDKRFNQLKRFLARELHPDLSGEDVVERRVREQIFKRVWAKIEQIQ
jgi:hypothetical protein